MLLFLNRLPTFPFPVPVGKRGRVRIGLGSAPQQWFMTVKTEGVIECHVGTVNTQWGVLFDCFSKGVQKRISCRFSELRMSPEKFLVTSDDQLQELIRPAGFFTQKCAYLKAMAAFMLEREVAFEQSTDVWALRKELLAVKGVGQETADSILLYAFNKPIFVIDAYTRRVAERHLHLDGTLPYDILQKIFMDALPPDVAIYKEYHALIVALCKESCKKSGCGEICKSFWR